MKAIGSYVIGFLAFFPLALVFAWAGLNALSQEADNRAARQLEFDKRHMLKVEAISKKYRVEECVFTDAEIRCPFISRQGELKMLAAK